jgi:hypothetical protein
VAWSTKTQEFFGHRMFPLQDTSQKPRFHNTRARTMRILLYVKLLPTQFLGPPDNGSYCSVVIVLESGIFLIQPAFGPEGQKIMKIM